MFRGKPGRRVSLVGDFNNWDPFMDPLDETSPGSYSVTLRVPAGGSLVLLLQRRPPHP